VKTRIVNGACASVDLNGKPIKEIQRISALK